MGGVLKALSEFLESDLAQSYGWVIAISFIICLAISWSVMYFIFVKIIVPSKTVENIELKRIKEELSKELNECKKEKEDLERANHELEEEIQHFRFIKSLESDNPKPSDSKALKKFL